MDNESLPVYSPPTGAPDWEGPNGLDHLKRHLQTALTLELYTIPLYLYAAYSIKDRDSPSRKLILGIAHDEMLHLGLVGNIITSIGGTPQIYEKNVTPQYTAKLFYDGLQLDLKAATRETIQTFQRLEAPAGETQMRAPPHLLPEYNTIGEFYHSTIEGIKLVHDKLKREGKELFLSKTFGRQFSKHDSSWDRDDHMKVIETIEVATTALDLIVEQGEGTNGDVDNHWEIFSKMLDRQQKPLDCWDVVENPRTSDYIKEKDIHSVMLLSDATYGYLMVTIQALWHYDATLDVRKSIVEANIWSCMTALKHLSNFLVQQKLSNGKHAASPFNFHRFTSIETARAELAALTEKAVALNKPGVLQDVVKSLEGLVNVASLIKPR